MTIKERLFALLAALQEVQDNYGINECQRVQFNGQKNELADIIASITDAPPVPPVTVDAVLAGVGVRLETLAGTVLHDFIDVREAVDTMASKVDALIALANAAAPEETPA